MSLKRNIASLQLLQLSSFCIPLIIQPWLARSLGPAGYGRYNFIIAVISYFILFADFGFNWSATRALAIHRDQGERSAIVCTTYAAKALLAIAGLLALIIAICSMRMLQSEAWLLLIAYASVLGSVLAPVWYFQGIESPHITSLIDITVRLSSVPVVLLIVKSPADVATAIVLNAAVQLLIGLIGLRLLLEKRQITWVTPAWRDVVARIRTGFPLFLSMSAVSLYTTSNSVILGAVAKSEQLAFFSAAQKLSSAACSLFVPINQALYPRISNHFSQGFEGGMRLAKRALYAELVLGLTLSVTLFFSSNWLCTVLFGQAYAPAAVVLRWLSVLPILLAFIGVFANLIMIPLGLDSKHIRMVFGAALVNLASILPLIHFFGAVGAAVAVCAAEFFVLAYSGYCVSTAVKAARRSK